MQSILLQPWITVRGAPSITSITQDADSWADVSTFQDVVFWLDCREATLGGASSLMMFYETSATRDEVLFAKTVSISMAVPSATPSVSPWLAVTNPSPPLSRYLRWRIVQTGATGTWDATFRIFASLSPKG